MIVALLFEVLLPVMLIVGLWVRHRRQPPGDLFEHARALIDRNLPLAPGLWQASRSLTGRSRRTMQAVCEMLEVGVPLDYAAERAFGRGCLRSTPTCSHSGRSTARWAGRWTRCAGIARGGSLARSPCCC